MRNATPECHVSKANQLHLHKIRFLSGALHSALPGDRKKEVSIDYSEAIPVTQRTWSLQKNAMWKLFS